MALIAIGGCGVVLFAQASGGAVAGLQAIPASERIRTAITAYSIYLCLAAWPVPLSIFYPYSFVDFG